MGLRLLQRPLTLSLSFSFSLSMDLFSPSSSRSISLTVSPERVLNFFLDKFGREQSRGVAAGSEPQSGSLPQVSMADIITATLNPHADASGRYICYNQANQMSITNRTRAERLITPTTPPRFCLLAAITASPRGCAKPSLSG